MRKILRLLSCVIVSVMLCSCAGESVPEESVTYGAVERAGNFCFKITPSQFEDLFNENLKDEKNRIGNCEKTISDDYTTYKYNLNDNGTLMLVTLNGSEYVSGAQFVVFENTQFKEEYADIAVKLIDSSYDFETILNWLSEEGDTDSQGNFNSSIYKPFGKYEISFVWSVSSNATGDAPSQIFGFSAVPKENVFTAGTYEVGIDLDEGSYDINVKNGSGTCLINDGDILKEDFAYGTGGVSGYQNARLKEGDIIKISGNVELEFYPNY